MFNSLLSDAAVSDWTVLSSRGGWAVGVLLLVMAVAVSVWLVLNYKRRLHRHHAVLEGVLDMSREPVLTLDAQGRILQCNASTHRLFGHPMGTLVGTP